MDEVFIQVRISQCYSQAVTVTSPAKLLGISRQTLYDILVEKQPVTVAMALRLGKLIGSGPLLWLNLQRAYDLEQAEREIDVSSIPTLEVA